MELTVTYFDPQYRRYHKKGFVVLNKIKNIFTIFIGLCIAVSSQAKNQNILDEVLVNQISTKIRTVKSNNVSKKPILLIALHGDAPFNNPSYQYGFVKKVANKINNLIAIGMLRPGYTDGRNRTSDGIKGDAIGDNYDKTRVKQIAEAIIELKRYYKPSKLILAGHSGGAAITANLIALYPDLVDHAYLVSCPCNVNSWRKDMYKLTKKPIFNGELNTLSPIDLIASISKNTKISIIIGRNDVVSKAYLSKEYKSALEKVGIDVSLKMVKGEHNIFLNNEVIYSIRKIINIYNNTIPSEK